MSPHILTVTVMALVYALYRGMGWGAGSLGEPPWRILVGALLFVVGAMVVRWRASR